MTTDPARFRAKLIHLHAPPDETSHDGVTLKSGTVLDFHTAPVLGQDGTYHGRIWTYRDITASSWRFPSARDGQEGWEQARRSLPAAILLALQLPGISGEEVLRRLRGDPATRAQSP